MSLDIRPTLDPIFDALGVEATVTPLGGDPVDTTVIWLTPLPEDVPGAGDFHRRESIKVMEMRKDAVPSAPRGSRIDAPEIAGGEIRAWRTEATLQEDAECRRVIVVPAGDES